MVHPNQTIHQVMMDSVHETYPSIPVFKSIIENTTVLKQSQYMNQDIFQYDQKSKAAVAYMELAHEVISNE